MHAQRSNAAEATRANESGLDRQIETTKKKLENEQAALHKYSRKSVARVALGLSQTVTSLRGRLRDLLLLKRNQQDKVPLADDTG